MSTGSGSTSELAHEGAVPSEYHDRPSHAHPLKVVDGGCAAGGAVGVVVDVVGAGVVAVGAVGLDDDPPLHLDNASERKTTKTSADRRHATLNEVPLVATAQQVRDVVIEIGLQIHIEAFIGPVDAGVEGGKA